MLKYYPNTGRAVHFDRKPFMSNVEEVIGTVFDIDICIPKHRDLWKKPERKGVIDR